MEELEDLNIRPTDLILLAAVNDEDYNHLDICMNSVLPQTQPLLVPHNRYLFLTNRDLSDLITLIVSI